MHRFKLLFVLYALGCAAVHGQPVSEPQRRDNVLGVSEQFMTVRELTGHNDHPSIQLFWSLINPAYYRTRPPYCAAYVYYCFRTAGLKPRVKTPSLAASWYNRDLVVWEYNPHGNQRRVNEPKKGSVVLYRFYSNGKYRIAHVGILAEERRKGSTDFIVNEANTSASGAVGQLTERDREGNGIYKKRRSEKSVYAITDWIPVSAP